MPNAVITGGTQGIGKAIAEKLLSQGFDVAICARTQTDLEQCKEEWKQVFPGRHVIACRADLSRKEDVHSFGSEVAKNFPIVDILVNNAGLFYPGELMTEEDGHLEQLMQVNLYSAYHLTRSLLPLIKQSSGGHIFNMCSVASLKAYPNGGAYGITKYALLGFSDNLRHELIPSGIRVTSICPGATASRSWEGAGIPTGRIMEASDVAEMVWTSYQLSPQANVDTIVMRPQKGDL